MTTLNDEMKRTLLLNGCQIRCWMKVGGKVKSSADSQNDSNISTDNTTNQDNISIDSQDGNIVKSTFAAIVANSSSGSNGSNRSTDGTSQRNDTQSAAATQVEAGTGTGSGTETGIGRMMTADITDLMGSDWRLLR